MAGLKRKQLEEWMGKIGFVKPNFGRTTTARIAVKVIGVNFTYGRWVFEVEPLAGTGTWQVDVNSVDFGDDS